jgi:agmatine deiminase
MIADRETDTAVFADRLPGQFPRLWDRLSGLLREHGVSVHLARGCRDVWARDFLPVQVGGGFVSFLYAPDYLRAYDHLRTDESVCDAVPFLTARRRSDLVIDGGNLVSSGSLVAVTDKVYRENPDRSREGIRRELARLLGASSCVVLPKEPGDPIGHADGLVRFLDERTAVTNDYTDIDPAYGRRVAAVLARHGFEVVTLPYSVDPTGTDGIPSAVGNRVNFLRVGNLVVVPGYGLPADRTAVGILRGRLPNCTVVSLDATDLARRGGVLNCLVGTYRTVSGPMPG